MALKNALPKVCIIGAGCSGFTTAKRLKDYGIPFDVFEASDNIGGNWYYGNPNGKSARYRVAGRTPWRSSRRYRRGSGRCLNSLPPGTAASRLPTNWG